MKKLIAILFCALCLAAHADDYTEIHGTGIYSTSDHSRADAHRERLKKEFEREGLTAMAERTDRALDGLFKIAVMNLKRRGYYEEADYIQRGWSRQKGQLQVLHASARDIGDFEPLMTWLAVAYEIIEFKLGYNLCYTLRISDLKTFNYTIPVVFKPCAHPLTDFTEHFVHDERYRGLCPVVAYWTTSITCSIATFGAGYFFICSPIAMLVELGFDKAVAPWLAPKIYNWACGGEK